MQEWLSEIQFHLPGKFLFPLVLILASVPFLQNTFLLPECHLIPSRGVLPLKEVFAL